jgi:uncharacterized membrane protein (DUF373 family)
MKVASTHFPSSMHSQKKCLSCEPKMRVVNTLQGLQDLITVLMCIGLLGFMFVQTWDIFSCLVGALDFKRIAAKVLFTLILVELFRLLIIYLEDQCISVEVAVEVTIVSILREVIVHGILETSWVQILAACGLLSTLILCQLVFRHNARAVSLGNSKYLSKIRQKYTHVP